jgi:hypothetical protein
MKLYLDMDGVIADFFGTLEKEFEVDHWKDLEDPVLAIEGLRNTDWFNQLEPFGTSKKLVAACRDIAQSDYGVCSSPIQGDDMNSGFWKRTWLTRHEFLPEIQNFVITQEKWKFANDPIDGLPNILVDDNPGNIQKWKAAGGIGFLYQANRDNVDDLIVTLRATFRTTSYLNPYL